MFRVVPSPIIRSANNCIYSIWYLSHRYCYLPLSWKSWNGTFSPATMYWTCLLLHVFSTSIQKAGVAVSRSYRITQWESFHGKHWNGRIRDGRNMVTEKKNPQLWWKTGHRSPSPELLATFILPALTIRNFHQSRVRVSGLFIRYPV